jgi:membrane protein YqaA with SNARE-associated domain
MVKCKLVILPALLKLGFGGAFAGALLDSSTIPIPMDFFLAAYIWNDRPHFWLYCLLASAGSALGGLLPYGLGRAGGELFLLKRVNRERFEKIRARFESQEMLALIIPSMLPPPAPWKLFVFAAGVFEMRVVSFLGAVFIGRMIRWLLLSALVIKLGPGAVDVIAHHAPQVALGVFALALAGFALWWFQKGRAAKLQAE